MYAITSKHQEDSTCKDNNPKFFITTNFDKFYREGKINGSHNMAQQRHNVRENEIFQKSRFSYLTPY